MKIPDAINLAYSGGSGGCLLLHLLLLSGKFYCNFVNKTIPQVIAEQWNIKNPNFWKNHESWPDNKLTHDSVTNLNKIYFYCNPEIELKVGEYSNYTVMIYTDYDSQHRLAKYKRANWYFMTTGDYSDSHDISSLTQGWVIHYNRIRDSTWPDCLQFKDVYNLPIHIQEEILSNPHTDKYLATINPTSLFNDCEVYTSQLVFLRESDIVIKLQDLVNSQAEILQDIFKFIINDQQRYLIDHWKKLHTDNLLATIGIKP